MTALTLKIAQQILDDTLKAARERNLQPCSVAVVDAGGALKASGSEDGSSPMRWKIALGKAAGAAGLGVGSRRIGAMALERPHFVAALHSLADNGLVPVAGGVLIRNAHKQIIGAVGVSGDIADNDEEVAITAILAAGLVADAG